MTHANPAAPPSRAAPEARQGWLAGPWPFFAGVFAWTWTALGLAIALGARMDTPLGLGLFVLGLAGPMIVGVSLVTLTEDAAGRRDYARRIVDARRIGLRWGAVIVLFVPALHGLAALLDLALGGTGAAWGDAVVEAATDPFGLVLAALFALVAPFVEELGWRGVGLERLQQTRSALASTLVLGTLWSLWHLPAFFLPGSFQAEQGVGTGAFWLLLVGIVLLSFAFTWIYNNTGRSIVAAVLFHGMVNFTSELFDIAERANTISMVLWGLAAVAIVVGWGPRTFTRSSPAPLAVPPSAPSAS